MLLDKDFGISRDELMVKLRDKGIDTRPFFYPLSQMPMYTYGRINPVAHDISMRGLNLPSEVNLSMNKIMIICEKVIDSLSAKKNIS